MVMARWPWPSSLPGSAALAAMAAATRSASKLAQARTVPGEAKSTTSMRTGPSLLVCRMKRPSNLSAEAQHHCQHDGLAEKLRHRRRVIVAGQDGIDRGAQPHDAAAQVEGLHRKRQDGVVAAGLLGLADGNGEFGIVHRA